MKRSISILLALLVILSATAFATEIPQISAGMFPIAKQTLVSLAAAEYEKLVTLLPFSDVAPSAAEWQNFAEGNFTTLSGTVQTDYAVAYWSCGVWMLAVPVAEPSTDTVEALILTSADGLSFSGYRYATWAEVKSEYLSAPYVTWDVEYLCGAPVVTAD